MDIIIVCIVIYKKRKNIKEEGSEEESRMPSIERHVLPPPYRKEDPAATRGLLFDRKLHEDYLQVRVDIPPGQPVIKLAKYNDAAPALTVAEPKVTEVEVPQYVYKAVNEKVELAPLCHNGLGFAVPCA